jgi:hypothetical protein
MLKYEKKIYFDFDFFFEKANTKPVDAKFIYF